MTFLLDTHIFLWFVNDDPRLSNALKDLIEDELAFEYFTIEKIEAQKMSTALESNHKLAKQTLDTLQKYTSIIDKLINTAKVDANQK